MKTDRESLLSALLSVQAGLSKNEIIEQSSCFVFHEGHVWTFNDEVACRIATDLDITGAVKSGPLLTLLQKIPDDTVEVSMGEGELLVKGKRRNAGVRMEAEVLLPIEGIELPEKWKKLPDDFCTGIEVVQKCASKNEMNFDLCCVHLTSEWVEACNNFQLARYPMKMPMKKNRLVRKDSMKAVAGLGVTKYAETENWVHFSNPAGVSISCRSYMEEYPDLGKLFEFEGAEVTFPKGAKDAADVASIFSAENQEENEVLVGVQPGRLVISGMGDSGWYKESRKMKYDGASFQFAIAPELLKEIVSEYSQCEISPTVLKASTGTWTFASALSAAANGSSSNDNSEDGAEDTEEEEVPEKQKQTKRKKASKKSCKSKKKPVEDEEAPW